MRVEYLAQISAVRANIVDGYIVISTELKLNEIDDDGRDNLAELCRLNLPADVCISTAEGKNLELSCHVDSFRGNLSEKTAVVALRIPRNEITPAAEGLLAMCSGWTRWLP